jgi:hypothetical protein
MLFEQYKVANYYQKIVIPFLRLKYGGWLIAIKHIENMIG